MASRDRFDRTARFVSEGAFGSRDVLTGYQDVTKDPISKDFIKRNLAPYQAVGVPLNLKKLRGKTDTQLERLAARAVVKKRKVPLRKKR